MDARLIFVYSLFGLVSKARHFEEWPQDPTFNRVFRENKESVCFIFIFIVPRDE